MHPPNIPMVGSPDSCSVPSTPTIQWHGEQQDEQANFWDIEEARAALRHASSELTLKGLVLAAKWASEQLIGLPRGERKPQEIFLGSQDKEEEDLVLYAQSLFHMGELDRVASYLSQPLGTVRQSQHASAITAPVLTSHVKTEAKGRIVGPPLEEMSPHGIYLRAYALYLSGERKKEEEIAELVDPLERTRVTNGNLTQLQSELFILYHTQKLDAFGTYVYGMVLKEVQKSQINTLSDAMKSLSMNDLKSLSEETDMVHAILVDSLQQYPCNWSAWLDLASVCVDNPSLQQEVDYMLQSNAILTNHWMYHMFLVHVFLEQQQNELALQLIDGLQYRPPPPNDPDGESSGLFSNSNYLKAMQAIAYYNLRDFDTAQEHFIELCQRDPIRLEHMDIFSNILYVKESKAELSHLAHSAIRNDKYRPETCCIVGNYYSSKGQHEKAVHYFQRALKLDRTYLSAWTLMGHEYVEMKNTAAAVEAYRRAVDINARDYRAWYGLGQTYELMSMPLYALFYYRKAAALRPYDARMWCAIGGCYMSLDKRSDAVRSYERAVSNHDREGIATQKLASLYREAGEFEQAARCYQRHLNLRIQAVCDTGSMDLTNDDDGLDAIHVEATEAEAILYLAFYHKDHQNYMKATRFCSRLLEYPGPEKEQAKALLREIRSRCASDNMRNT